MTGRNPLLSYKHASRGRKCVRVIDELPNELYRRLDNDEAMRFKSLGEPESEPADEKRIEFRRALDAAKLDDAEYLTALAEAGEEPGERVLEELDNDLRKRVREGLGMPPRGERPATSSAEAAKRRGLDPSFDLPALPKGEWASHHADGFIQTVLFSEQLERTLSGLREEVRSSLQETGVNPLFCVFGFLEWYEDDNSRVQMHAPLLLLPLEIDRDLTRGKWEYRVKSSGEGMTHNVALSERLKRDFDLPLPPFEEDDTPEEYFAKIAKLIEGKRGWKVRRWITLGLFSFAKIAMYHDLDPDKWSGNGLVGHAGTARLLGGDGEQGGFVNGGAATSGASWREPEQESAHELDRVELTTPLITEADSSQLEAIQSVRSGRSLVIEGPPGTGKSQTITNMIAGAMHDGKTVLFIAEKMAALNVVRNRLEHSGLGEFCFELHSNKAGRKETFAALARRLAMRAPRSVESEVDAVVGDLAKGRKQLTAIVEALGETIGKQGITLQQLLWRVQTARAASSGLPREVDEVWLEHAEGMTDQDLGRVLECASRFAAKRQEITREYGSIEAHPWRGIGRAELDVLACDQVTTSVGRLEEAAVEAQTVVDDAATATGWSAARLSDLAELAAVIEIAAPGTAGECELIGKLLNPQNLSASERFIARFEAHRAELAGLSRLIQNPDADLRGADFVAAGASLGSVVVESMPCGQLSAEHARLNTLASSYQSGAQAIGTARVHLTSVEESAEGDEALIAGAMLAVEAGARIIAGRQPELMKEDAAAIVEQAQTEQRRLVATREELRKRFVLEDCPASQILREHARAVRSAPFLPVLSSAYRRAQTLWRGMCKSPGKGGRAVMAMDFDVLAEHRAAAERFDANEEYARTLGPGFKGLDSKLDDALATARWAIAVRKRFRAGAPAGQIVERILLSGGEREIDALRALAEDGRFGHACASVADGSLPGKSIAAKATEIASKRDALQSGIQEATRLGVCAETRVSELAVIAQAIGARNALREELAESHIAETVLGSRFAGAKTDIRGLAASVEYVRRVSAATLPTELRTWMIEKDARARHTEIVGLAQRAKAAREQIRTRIDALGAITPVDYRSWIGHESAMDVSAEDLRLHCGKCARDPGGLQMLVEDARLLEDLRREGVGEVVDVCFRKGVSVERLPATTRRVLLQSMARSALTRNPAMVNFSGERHEGVRRNFRDLDRKLCDLRRRQIALNVLKRSTPEGNDRGSVTTWTEMSLICHVAGLQRPRTSIRHLLKQSCAAIQQLMPCFMMSPLSVAQYLQPGGPKFDLVIMDEASQLRPEDAMGAVARGGQVVIVGDPKQLPPTSFFTGSSNTVEEGDEDGAVTVADEQSILDAAMTVLRPMKRLKWHYRSKHGSLIAYSNKEFYDNELVVFPSPQHQHPEYGVRYEHVEEGAYRAGINPPEALRVAMAVIKHAERSPERSLGVVALNKKQAELLGLEIDRLAAENEQFEAWRKSREGTLEPFFVKNLENVQGDERDVIMISTVYGKDEQGAMAQRFGPINSAGGHRRLNVLFTRSKIQTIVFSSMKPEDIRVDEKSQWGVRALQGYLKYAKHRSLDGALPSGREPDSDFEIAVAKAIREAGFEVVPQVGVVGYFIDMAVRHPEKPGEFVVGIECDGAMYHSTKSARDRDRLRQEVLERLGWRIQRVWSLDWYRDPVREAARIVKGVREAVAASAEEEE